ncbi:hypothetical protein SELMODRAFT_267, partial [Selaginella moellendorffii]
DAFVAAGLIQMYAKRGRMEEAWESFRGAGVKDAVVWSSMITASARNGDFGAALLLVKEMLLDGVLPDVIALTAALAACTRPEALSQGKLLHAWILDCGCEADLFVVTALVTMYGKCGSLERSKDVFDRSSCRRNLVLWTSMIGVYVQHSRFAQALGMFRQMQLEGVKPNKVTFISIAGGIVDMNQGKLIYELARECTLALHDIVVRTALIGMFSRCGDIRSCEMLFQTTVCHERTLSSWNVMLGVYSEHEKQQHKAFHLFRRMLLQGLLPERVSFLALLSACRSLDCGKSVEGWILEAGLECDLVVGAALVSMYGRCGSLGDAFQVFQNFENDADMVFWNSMIAACVDAHASSMALELFRRMQLQGVKHNKVTLVSVLSACAKCHNISYGKQLHEHLVVTGIDRDEYLQNALLNLYGVCGSVKDALNVFVNVERWTVVSCTATMAALSDNGLHAEAMVLFRMMLLEGVAADKVTYISLLQSSRNFHPEELLRVANAGIHALGLVEDVIIATGVLRSYSQCKQVERAVQVFNKMRFAGQDDAVTWTSMLSAYADNGQHEKAVELLHRMQLEGVKPDKSAFVKALNACAACGRLRLGALVHANVEAAGATLNAGVGSALVSLYGSLGKLETGRELFEKLPHKDVFSWTALVSAYSDAGQHEAAVQVFRSMQQFGIQPDAVSILAVLKSSPSSIDATDLRLSLESWSSSCRISIYTEMLSLQGKHGRLDEASFIFDQMEEKDSVAWNAIITTYAQHGHTDKVMEMFQRMQVEGVEADSGTFASITCACSHGGMVREGCSYFAWMLDEFGVARVEQNYASVVDLLGRAGEMEEAERAASCSRVEGMMSNKSMLWKTMLSSCRASSDVKRGVDAASEVLSKQPRNPEAYVLLSTL